MFEEHRGSPGAGDSGMTDLVGYGMDFDFHPEPEGKPLDCSEQRHEVLRFKGVGMGQGQRRETS